MKKFLTCLVSTILLVSLACASSMALTSKNRSVDAISFIELSIKRSLEAEKSTGIEIARIGDYYYNDIPLALHGQIRANCAIGTLFINPSDLSVIKYESMFMNLSQDDEYNQKLMYATLVAMSILEYGETEESLLRIDEKKSAFRKMEGIFFGQISELMDSNLFWLELKAGKEKIIFSGNFTYTLHYFETTHPKSNEVQELVMLLAQQ